MLLHGVESTDGGADSGDGTGVEPVLDGLASFLFDKSPPGGSDSGFPVEVVGNADAAGA